MNLPAGYPTEARNIGFEWSDPGRIQRINAVLGAQPRGTIADSMALQMDVFCHAALRGVALLRGLSSPDKRIAQALALLAAWDGHETKDSAAAAIAEVWLNKHLAPATAARVMTPAAAAIVAYGTPRAVVGYLEAEDVGGARDEILLESLAAALDDIAARLGADMAAWRWGDLHHAHFVPPAAHLADPDLRARMSHGPVALPGSAFTPAAATYRMTDFAVTNGASFRMVLDVGDWDESRVINSPGQSGDPDSPHYSDLFPLWAEGRYVPLLFTRAAVVKAAKRVITLTPGA
jgi:penicillin amidase